MIEIDSCIQIERRQNKISVDDFILFVFVMNVVSLNG